ARARQRGVVETGKRVFFLDAVLQASDRQRVVVANVPIDAAEPARYFVLVFGPASRARSRHGVRRRRRGVRSTPAAFRAATVDFDVLASHVEEQAVPQNRAAHECRQRLARLQILRAILVDLTFVAPLETRPAVRTVVDILRSPHPRFRTIDVLASELPIVGAATRGDAYHAAGGATVFHRIA